MAERRPLIILEGSITEGGGEGAPLVLTDAGMVGELPEGDTLLGAFSSNALNFISRVRAGIKVSARAVMIAARKTVAIRISALVAILRMQVKTGIRVVGLYNGTAQVLVKNGIKVSNRSTGSSAKPQAKAGFKVTETFVRLQRYVGAASIVQEAVGGRSDWANPNNATGINNGVNATFAGNALGARGGRLVGSYAASVDKAALTITLVQMRFHVSQSSTVLNNGTLRLGYRINGGGDVLLAAITDNQNYIGSSLQFDLTSVVGGSWAALDTLKSFAETNTPLGNTSAAAVDAFELYVEANKTEAQ